MFQYYLKRLYLILNLLGDGLKRKIVLSKTLSEGDMNYEDKFAFLNLILV